MLKEQNVRTRHCNTSRSLTDYSGVVNVLVTGSSSACEDKPCLNGGKCHVVGSSFYCECQKYYIGRQCEGTYRKLYVIKL